MIGTIIIGILFFILGVMGILYSEKIARATTKSHGKLYGYVLGKKTKKAINKDTTFSGFMRFIIILISLGLIWIGILILKGK